MKIAIIVPMAQEAEYYHKHFPDSEKKVFGSAEFEHFSVNGNDIYLGLSGIGKVNAAMNLTSLLTKEKIDLIFMTGSAGALQKEIQQKDLILPTSFTYHDAHNTLAGDYVEGQIPQEPAKYELNSEARKEFVDFLENEGIEFKEGLIVTGDSFIGSKAQKEAIQQMFPEALGVEMEGAAFAQVANHFGIPLIALRAISDNGDDSAGEDFDVFVKEVGQKAAETISKYLESKVLD